MRRFDYSRAENVRHAAGATLSGDRIIAGGTNLLDLMKLQIETPERIVDITRLPLAEMKATEAGGMSIGALVSNSDCAANMTIRRDYGVLSQAILAGASGQLRNKATTGGNLCQRTRCPYFYDTAMPCNKRESGSGCQAIGGFNRIHAILGASDQCIATYPGDMAVAMYALDASVLIENADGVMRQLPVREFHLLPGDTPERDNILEAGEIITAVTLPAPVKNARHIYRKVRDRSSYAFALVSVAAVGAMRDGKICDISLAFGGLAHKPWHDPSVDAMLSGEKPSEALFAEAADLLLADAKGQGSNDFKIELTRRTLKSVLGDLTGGETA